MEYILQKIFVLTKEEIIVIVYQALQITLIIIINFNFINKKLIRLYYNTNYKRDFLFQEFTKFIKGYKHKYDFFYFVY